MKINSFYLIFISLIIHETYSAISSHRHRRNKRKRSNTIKVRESELIDFNNKAKGILDEVVLIELLLAQIEENSENIDDIKPSIVNKYIEVIQEILKTIGELKKDPNISQVYNLLDDQGQQYKEMITLMNDIVNRKTKRSLKNWFWQKVRKRNDLIKDTIEVAAKFTGDAADKGLSVLNTLHKATDEIIDIMESEKDESEEEDYEEYGEEQYEEEEYEGDDAEDDYIYLKSKPGKKRTNKRKNKRKMF